MPGDSRLFERIEKLYDVGLIGQATALIAGCGWGKPGRAPARDVRGAKLRTVRQPIARRGKRHSSRLWSALRGSNEDRGVV